MLMQSLHNCQKAVWEKKKEKYLSTMNSHKCASSCSFMLVTGTLNNNTKCVSVFSLTTSDQCSHQHYFVRVSHRAIF